MSKGRIYRAQMTGTGDVKGRIYRAQMTGTAPVGAKGRIYRAQMTGLAAVLLAPFTDRNVEPMTTQTLTAVLATGSDTPDSYTWRVVPTTGSTSVAILGTGATVTITSPATSSGAFVVIGVRAVKGALISPEQTIRITTPPHLRWAATSSGWVPRAAPAFL